MAKNFVLANRIDNLTKKMEDPNAEKIIHVDYESFSNAEKTLFRKVNEIEEEFQKTGNEEILIKNPELLFKEFDVILRRITELYCYAIPKTLSCYENKEIVDYFFKLHFYNFDADLAEIMAFVHTWTEEEKEEFVSDLKKGKIKYFRIPRRYTELNYQEDSTSQDSEELNKTNAQNQEKEGG